MSYSWRDDEEKDEEEEEEKIKPRPMSDVGLRLHEGKRKKAAERERWMKKKLKNLQIGHKNISTN